MTGGHVGHVTRETEIRCVTPVHALSHSVAARHLTVFPHAQVRDSRPRSELPSVTLQSFPEVCKS